MAEAQKTPFFWGWPDSWRGWAWDPVSIVIYCVAVFAALRFWLGGANYLPSGAWFALCFVIPTFVLVGISTRSFCVPLAVDGPTAFHLLATLVYVQIDLCVARRLVGDDASFGPWTLPSLLADKLSLRSSTDDFDDAVRGDGLTPLGVPPLGRTLFEANGALLHEVFWNVFVCQNWLDARGLPTPAAILAVPATSCLVHAIVSNVNTGIRCLPNFLWVALAYHASGSVLPPGLIHAMWYLTDAKLCFALRTMKRDWDVGDRTNERGTPPWDHATCTIGAILVLVFYLSLNALVRFVPALRSTAAAGPVFGREGSACRDYQDVGRVVPAVLVAAVSGMLLTGALFWAPIRGGMDILAQTGEFTADGANKCAVGVKEADARQRDRIRRLLTNAGLGSLMGRFFLVSDGEKGENADDDVPVEEGLDGLCATPCSTYSTMLP